MGLMSFGQWQWKNAVAIDMKMTMAMTTNWTSTHRPSQESLFLHCTYFIAIIRRGLQALKLFPVPIKLILAISTFWVSVIPFVVIFFSELQKSLKLCVVVNKGTWRTTSTLAISTVSPFSAWWTLPSARWTVSIPAQLCSRPRQSRFSTVSSSSFSKRLPSSDLLKKVQASH